MTPTPRTFSHIGLSVPDLDAAVKFYSEVLGLYVVMEPSEAVEDDSAIGVMCTDVFGPGWGSLRIGIYRQRMASMRSTRRRTTAFGRVFGATMAPRRGPAGPFRLETPAKRNN